MNSAAKILFPGFLAAFLGVTALGANAGELALIPLPQKVQQTEGTFTLTPDTCIYTDRASRDSAEFLAQRLRTATGYPLKIHHWTSSNVPQNGIFLTTQDAKTDLGDEGYDLTVDSQGIVIRAPAQAGLFYGGETFMQLLPPAIFSTNQIAGTTWEAPCVQIEDWPRFKWRGLMLDVSRHFYSKTDVEALIDEMSLYKLNRFHWHLVDDDGWRLQVKKYPKLTEIGAWRDHALLDRTVNEETKQTAHLTWMEPSPDKFGPDGRYGGYYTEKDVREVVAYAAQRHIMVIPEIEMPGHSGAAVASYPELGCSSEPYVMEKAGQLGVLNVASPQTYAFYESVLKEVFNLFPAPYVHIGGDEVPEGAWDGNAACRALMKEQGFTNDFQLQSYFIQRMEKFINANNKTLIGWSEILKGGLATNAVVMDWIGGGKEAVEAGHDAVMTPCAPTDYCYFDHYQSMDHHAEPQAIGGFLPLKTVYSFEPIPANLSPALQSHILGPQGNLWTEWIASFPHAQYMIFPRACAMAEVGWSSRDARDWQDFQRRLAADKMRLDALGVNYRHE
jgi:hexosaminidase